MLFHSTKLYDFATLCQQHAIPMQPYCLVAVLPLTTCHAAVLLVNCFILSHVVVGYNGLIYQNVV